MYKQLFPTLGSAWPDRKKEKKVIPTENRKIPDRRINPDRRCNSSAHTTKTRVLNTNEACLFLRISRPTFLKLIFAGKIRAQKAGKGWRVLGSELERFLLAGKTAR
jgi:excisionase family DNA binding protein